MIFAIVVSCVAFFAGGIVATQLTAGESKGEAAIYGIIVWATAVAIIGHGAAERSHFFRSPTSVSSTSPPGDWQIAARKAGATGVQIDELQTKIATNPRSNDPAMVDVESTRRMAWFAFAAIWLSMASATLGGLFGAGPTFRFVQGPGSWNRPLTAPTASSRIS